MLLLKKKTSKAFKGSLRGQRKIRRKDRLTLVAECPLPLLSVVHVVVVELTEVREPLSGWMVISKDMSSNDVLSSISLQKEGKSELAIYSTVSIFMFSSNLLTLD